MIEEPHKLEETPIQFDSQNIEETQKNDEPNANKDIVSKNEDKDNIYTQTIDPNIFVYQDLVKNFLCPLCHGVLYEPMIPCSQDIKSYCRNCIEKYLKNNDNKCPGCNLVIDKVPQKFDIIQESIKYLDAKCKNAKYGCIWQGKYIDYDKHILECPKEETHCVFQGCDKVFMRESLDSHLKLCPFRVIMCEKCGINIIASELVKHKNECPKEIIKCPQKCGLKFERCFLDEHIDKCPFTLVKCPFEKIGCNEVIMRSEFYKKMHENLPKHINLLLNDYLIFKELSKNIWKQAGIDIEDNKEKIEIEKDKLKVLNETLDKMYKYNETNKELNKEEKDNRKENAKVEENKIKKYPLVEEEKNNDKLFYMTNEKNNLNNNKILNNHINEDKNNSKENINLMNDYSEKRVTPEQSFLNKKRERFEDQTDHDSNQNANNPEEIIEVKDSNEEDTYNTTEISKKFKISGNIIGSNCLEGNVHYFVFAHDSKKIKRNSEGEFSIKFELLEDVSWLSVGLCDKKKVEENGFTFAGRFKNNGFFFIATNNVIWHCDDPKQRKKITPPPTIMRLGAKNNIIECKYKPKTAMLSFYANKVFLAGLYDVKPMLADYLLPCLVFLKNCSVRTTFAYP